MAGLLSPRSTTGSSAPPRKLTKAGWPCPWYQRHALPHLCPKAPWALRVPVPPGLYACDTQQMYGGCVCGTGSPRRRVKRHIYIYCQCREAKCAKFWLQTCAENATVAASRTILPEDVTAAICTSSGKVVIVSTWPEDTLLPKQEQNEEKPP